jgi:hypothetical protein
MTIEAMEKLELPVLTLRAPAEVQVTKRAAQLPQAFERLLYPDGALPLPQAYERLQELFAHTKNPDAVLVPFLHGDLVIKVFDPERNRVFVLTPDQINGYVAEHGSHDLLFVRDVVADIADGPLAGYEGLAPYVEHSDFARLLEASLPQGDKFLGSRPSPLRRQSLKLSLKHWYLEWVKSGASDWLKQKGLSKVSPSADEDLNAARERFGNAVSRNMIRSLRQKFAPDGWKRPGKRSV